MSISPAMLNRAKRIPLRPVVTQFMGKEYTTSIPIKPFITVKQFLESFAEDNLKGEYKYNDLELIKDNEWLSYDHQIHKESEDQVFKIFFSKFDQKNFYEKREKRDHEKDAELSKINYGFFYDHEEINMFGKAKTNKNFFHYLMNVFPDYKLPDYAEKNKKIANIFNNEAALKQIQVNKEKYTNPWLYNPQTFPKIISPLNIQSWDPYYYKNLLTQILAPVVANNKNIYLDVDTKIKGLHTREKEVDFMITHREIGANIPLSIVDHIDEVQVFDSMRNELYDYFLPKDYPMFIYELVNPMNPEHMTEPVIKTINDINKTYGDMLKYRFDEFMLRMLEERAFKNFDILRTMSRGRLNVHNRVHIGISAYNDKLRFNLYHRPLHHQLEKIESLHRTPVYDLQIKPGTDEVTNLENFQEFVNIFNTVSNISPAVIDLVYEDFLTDVSLGLKKGFFAKREFNNAIKNRTKISEMERIEQLFRNQEPVLQ